MKKIFLKSVALFLLVCPILFGQTNNTTFILLNEEKLNVTLNNKVKTLNIKTENQVNKNDSDSVFYYFNPKGEAETIKYFGLGLDVFNKKIRVEEIHYVFKEKKLISKLNKMEFGFDGDIYEYDDRGNLINGKNYINNILVKESNFEYDSKNRKIKSTCYLFGGFSNYNEKTQENKSNFLYEIEKYEFNSNDKVILKAVSNFRNNKTTQISEYKYDERGNLIEEGNCLFYSSGTCTPKPIFGYEYNSRNQLTKKYQIAKFSPHNTDEYFVYDDKGNEIESKGMYVYTDRLPYWGYHYVYQYDEFGNKTKEEEILGNYRRLGPDEYKSQITQYDKYQNVISDQYLTAEGTTVKLIIKKYIYDKKGNWISMEKKEGNSKDNLILTQIIQRDIKYYR